MKSDTDSAAAIASTLSTSAPVMALRTYTALRLGSVTVIGVLAIAILKDRADSVNQCVQGSISAYFYTDVQAVFVGTLITLGFSMIVLWGRTGIENAFLNLAGLLAPVVAFVPSQDANRCGLTPPAGGAVKRTQDVLDAQVPAIVNNMTAYLWIVALALFGVLVRGLYVTVNRRTDGLVRPVAYWAAWVLALALLLVGATKFAGNQDWFAEHAHGWAANTMFIFIGIVVCDIGLQKWRGKVEPDRQPHRGWAVVYWCIAALMVVGFGLFHDPVGWLPAGVKSHHTLVLEAWEIALLAIFWLLQTWDRSRDGAPANL